MTKKLVNGIIPAHTLCPFRSQCAFVAAGACDHKGVNHSINYSCATARAYDLVQHNEAEHELRRVASNLSDDIPGGA